MLSRYGSGAVQLLRQSFIQNLIHKGALSGAGYTSNAGHHSQREGYVNIFQIIFRRLSHCDPACWRPALVRYGNTDAAA